MILVTAALPAAEHTGTAVFYSNILHGRPTADGGVYDKDALTAAHATLPYGTQVRVTNLANERSVVVRVTDRMGTKGPLIEVSGRAASELGFVRRGRARVRVEVLPEAAAAGVSPSS